jgi:hypothetical protein
MIKPLYSNQILPFRKVILHCYKRPFLYFLIAEIFIVGMWAEDVWEQGFFARSGAVVTLLALGLLWLWLHYGKELDQTKSYVDAMSKLAGQNHGPDFNVIIANVSRFAPSADRLTQIQLAAQVSRAVIDGPKMKEDLRKVSDLLGFSQIEVAALGTFVWAFGDLLM